MADPTRARAAEADVLVHRDQPVPAPGQESRGRSLARLATEVFDVAVS